MAMSTRDVTHRRDTPKIVSSQCLENEAAMQSGLERRGRIADNTSNKRSCSAPSWGRIVVSRSARGMSGAEPARYQLASGRYWISLLASIRSAKKAAAYGTGAKVLEPEPGHMV
jgi:hypothetical protein